MSFSRPLRHVAVEPSGIRCAHVLGVPPLLRALLVADDVSVSGPRPPSAWETLPQAALNSAPRGRGRGVGERPWGSGFSAPAEGGLRVAPSRRRWSRGPCPARSLDSPAASQALPLRPVPPGSAPRGHRAGPARSGWGRAGVTAGPRGREHSCGSPQATSWEGAPGVTLCLGRLDVTPHRHWGSRWVWVCSPQML